MKLAIDVSETATIGLRTGIQRVVRNIVLRSEGLSAKFGIEIVPVIARGSVFYRLENYAEILARPPIISSSSDIPAARSRVFVLAAIKRVLAAAPPAYRFAQRLLYARRQRQLLGGMHLSPLKLARGDALLLLDSFWDSAALKAAGRSREGGAKVIPVIHDLIPITHPNLCDDILIVAFKNAVRRAISMADGILSISEDSARQVREFVATELGGAGSVPEVDYFYHGSDFTSKGTFSEAEIAWPEGLWADEATVYLMVGTLEPRKGHAFVLDAFEQRWRAGAKDKLLIIGNIGLKVETLEERIRSSARLGRQLYMLNDATDAILAEAMRRAYACIVASSAEGFGLPVVEAMQMGLPVLASDIPVFREIGGEYPIYFSLDNPESLVQAMGKLAQHHDEIMRRLKNFRWQTWDEAAERCISKALALSRPITAK